MLSWLSGSGNVAAAAKRKAGIKGDITSRAAMDYLHGVLEMVKMAGYTGLLIVIDEAETILRMRKDVRARSMNGIRQICDMSAKYSGLVWVFTGTEEFFDSTRGVRGLEPLYDRIKFLEDGGFASRRQPQLRLSPFKRERLIEVAIKLRDMYPADDRSRIADRVSDEFIEALVAKVTAGFAGDVGVVPRHFLRELVTSMDRVDEYAEYNPADKLATEGYKVDPTDLARATGKLPNEDDDDTLMAAETVW